jgi:hypothetical protein
MINFGDSDINSWKAEMVLEFIKQEPELIQGLLDNIKDGKVIDKLNLKEYINKQKYLVTFEEYLKQDLKYPVDRRFNVVLTTISGKVSGYIHPSNQGGQTLNFEVKGNRVIFENLAI